MDKMTQKQFASRGGKARMAGLTRPQRVALAKRAAAIRRGRIPSEAPVRWWCLFLTQEDGSPRLEFASKDKQKVREYARAHHLGGCIDFVEYRPSLVVTRTFQSNPMNEVKALERTLSK